jgi:membrane protease subunit (stomatin/prohibitin family)
VPAGVAAPASADAAEQLEKLHDLLNKGAITQAEYDAKKAELLNRL